MAVVEDLGIAIIAFFAKGKINNMVPAGTVRSAVFTAITCGCTVTLVACFAEIFDPIPTELNLARAAASIPRCGITLVTVFTECHVFVTAAHGGCAIKTAWHNGPIAYLVVIHEVVAALFVGFTISAATISGFVVPIIACLIGFDYAVTACSELTSVSFLGAGVTEWA